MPTHPPEPELNDLGQPAWRIALFYPEQGGWTEADYFGLEGGPLVEFDDGCVEVLDIPNKEHQRIVQYLFVLMSKCVSEQRLGEVFIAPMPVRLWPRKFREPDVVFVSNGRSETDGYPDGADLVLEVVSPCLENRRRDVEIKSIEYAQAGIAEYWLIDPENRSLTVHRLSDHRYEIVIHDDASTVESVRIPGFQVSVAAILAAAAGPV
ncbi:MAG: Uma2 family endonuclease [Pirellula sp.]